MAPWTMAPEKTDAARTRGGEDHLRPKGEETPGPTAPEKDVMAQEVGFRAGPLRSCRGGGLGGG